MAHFLGFLEELVDFCGGEFTAAGSVGVGLDALLFGGFEELGLGCGGGDTEDSVEV